MTISRPSNSCAEFNIPELQCPPAYVIIRKLRKKSSDEGLSILRDICPKGHFYGEMPAGPLYLNICVGDIRVCIEN